MHTFRGVVLAVVLSLAILSCSSDHDRFKVSGVLISSADTPLEIADVGIRKTGFSERIAVEPDGSFEFSLPGPGAYFLSGTAAYHQSFFRPVYVEESTASEVVIHLASVRLLDSFTDVGVIGEFNEWNDDDGVLPLRQNENGIWTGTMSAPADTFAYQLMGVQFDEFMLAGTSYDWLVKETHYPTFSGHAGKYTSVLETPSDSVSITFDPSHLPIGEMDMQVDYVDPSSRAARINQLYNEFETTRMAFSNAMKAHRDSGGTFADLDFDWSGPKAQMNEKRAQEEDSTLIQYMILSHLEKYFPDSSDTDVARSLFEDVPPGSDMWSFVWGIPTNTLARASFMAGEEYDPDGYALQAVEQNPDSLVQAAFLAYVVQKRFTDMGQERAGLLNEEEHTGEATREFSVLFDQLITEYGDTHYADRAIKSFAPSRDIQPGNPSLPLISRTLPDTSATASLDDLKGTVTLLEFWALWCGPCIGEMPHLHEAYEQFADKGFEIISISVDEDPRDVAAFREEKWPMPWKHLWLEDGWESDAMKEYEVAGIPRSILIDSEGNILATGMEVRREKLVETVAMAIENAAIDSDSE